MTGRWIPPPDFLKQMASFFGGRLFTLIVEEAILAVFITWLGFNSMAVKLVAQVVVIVKGGAYTDRGLMEEPG